jgi:hypothetical protein
VQSEWKAMACIDSDAPCCEVCVLGIDGRATCLNSTLTGTEVPSGAYRSLDAGNRATCAISTDYSTVCWDGALSTPVRHEIAPVRRDTDRPA